MIKPLTVAAINKLKPGPKRRLIKDGGAQSLYLVVQPSGHKAWGMRFRKPNGAPAKLTLGPLDLSGQELQGAPVIGQPLTLVAARQLAAAVHRERALGNDVFRRVARAQAANTFGILARQFIEEHARPKTRRWRQTARTLGLRYPQDGGAPIVINDGLASRWAALAVTALDGHAIYAVIDEAKRHGMPGLARRNNGLSDARGRSMARALSRFFGWLMEHRKIVTNPCVGVYCPPAPPARERVLSNAEIRWFWQACDKLDAPFGPLLQLLLLTGQRLNEVAGMQRDELAADGTWHLPGTRTKNRSQHAVMLPALAVERIDHVKLVAGCSYVFTTTGHRPVSGWSKTKARLDAQMRSIAQQEITPWRLHDLRRTAVTGMAELGIAPHIIEAVVNHVSGHKAGVAGIYNRATYANEKRAALARWAAHVGALVGDNVVPMRAGLRV